MICSHAPADKKDPTANVPTTNATFIIASNFAHEAVERAWGMSDRGKAGLALVRARVMEEMRTTPCQWPDRKNPFGPALRNRCAYARSTVVALRCGACLQVVSFDMLGIPCYAS